jgi:hypothetical protein
LEETDAARVGDDGGGDGRASGSDAEVRTAWCHGDGQRRHKRTTKDGGGRWIGDAAWIVGAGPQAGDVDGGGG